MRPNIVIFADASWDPATGWAGWGAWIKSDGLAAIVTGAPFKAKMPHSRTAELCALVNATTIAKRRGILKGHVMLQSDCVEVLSIIRQFTGAADSPLPGECEVPMRRRKVRVPELFPARTIGALLAGLTVTVRHVRGHQSGPGRNWVNRECDRLASEAMRAARAAQSNFRPA